MRRSALYSSLTLAGLIVSSCQKSPDPIFVGKSEAEVSLIKRGQAVYMTHCIACHNQDPRKAGVLGPMIADASLELLRIRVLHAKYPEGYSPKPGPTGQLTNSMPAMPQLEADIPSLYAYISAINLGP